MKICGSGSLSFHAALVLLVFAAASRAVAAATLPKTTPSPAVSTAAAQSLTAPTSQLSAGSQCSATSVSPTAAEAGDEIVITGQGLSANCSVYFQNPAGGGHGTGGQAVDSSHLKVKVPMIASGKGTVAVSERTTAIVNPNSAANALPFEIKPTIPVLKSASPTAAAPGQKITVSGTNLRQGADYIAYFISSEAKKFSVPVEWLNVTTFRVTTPDIEKLAGEPDGPQNANKCFVTRAGLPSNSLAVKILTAPVLRTVSPAFEAPKAYVMLAGSYLTQDSEITFYTSSNQAFPAPTKKLYVAGLNVQVPDMPAGKGFVSAKSPGAAGTGSMIPFEVRPLTPLLAARADTFGGGIFGTRIKISDYAKVYKAYASPVTPQQPFACMAQYEVDQSGDVYTYIYTFEVNEFVLTTRILGRMGITWPDLNDTTLKYGVVESTSKFKAGDGKNVVTGDSIHDRELRMTTRSGRDLCVYIQSKRPPKLGDVQISDGFDQVCFISDFMVPTP
jgi:hypothetical protein